MMSTGPNEVTALPLETQLRGGERHNEFDEPFLGSRDELVCCDDPVAKVMAFHGEQDLSLESVCREQYRLNFHNQVILEHVADKELRARLPETLKRTTNGQLRVWLMRNKVPHYNIRRIVTPRYVFDLYEPPPAQNNKEAPAAQALPFMAQPCLYVRGDATDCTPDKRLVQLIRHMLSDLATEIPKNLVRETDTLHRLEQPQMAGEFNYYTALELDIAVQAYTISVFGFVHLVALHDVQ